MKTKKGFALAGTLAIMVVFLALSVLLFALVNFMMTNKKTAQKNLEIRTEVLQISQNFVDKNLQDFLAIYSDLPNSKLGNTTIFDKQSLQIEVNDDLIDTLKIFKNDKLLAEVLRQNNQIVKWQIFL